MARPERVTMQQLFKRLWNRRPGQAKTRPKGYISARVQRAGSDKWEDLGIISKPKKGGS